MKAVRSLLCAACALIAGCQSYDTPSHTPLSFSKGDRDLTESTAPAGRRSRPSRPAAARTELAAASSGDDLIYTKEGKAMLPLPPAPPVIDLRTNRAALTRQPVEEKTDRKEARWLGEFGRW